MPPGRPVRTRASSWTGWHIAARGLEKRRRGGDSNPRRRNLSNFLRFDPETGSATLCPRAPRGAGRLRSNVPGMAVAERIEVADAPERDRYELSVDGEVVGFTAYATRPGL